MLSNLWKDKLNLFKKVDQEKEDLLDDEDDEEDEDEIIVAKASKHSDSFRPSSGELPSANRGLYYSNFLRPN